MPTSPVPPAPSPAKPTPLRRRLRAARKLLLAGVGALLIVVGGFYGYLQVSNNFHEVEAGRYYRSAQLSPQELASAIERYGIRSVLNLRGPNAGKPWYDEEIAVTTGAGVRQLDYPISARQPVSLQQIAEIQALIAQAPKPLLVHCWDGADRTGLITAIYRLSQGAGAATAEEELSIRYGHFPYLGAKSRAMDDSFNAYLASRRAAPAAAR
ncbi:MAG: Protein tyrosine/serine phosphatase [Proteobacteria bacterium]|nr:Protein tyrosine/serine phosphatase [Pseudomonadota bacterium]